MFYTNILLTFYQHIKPLVITYIRLQLFITRLYLTGLIDVNFETTSIFTNQSAFSMITLPSTPVLIDWLSISGKSAGYNIELFKLVKLNYGTSVFSCIEELYHNNERICTVTSVPYSDVLEKNLIIVKFDNWLLYHEKFWYYYGEVLRELRIHSEKISRIDICKDFSRFYNKRLPANLIRDFLAGNITKLGKSKYSVWGETNRFLTYDYLSFGKKSSEINVYLYNKSRELKQVTDKPHIRNQWSKTDIDTSLDIFRLEISVKKSEIDLVDRLTGDCLNFNIANIFIQEDLENLFKTLCYKYFRFKKNTGQSNISREEDLILFKKEESRDIVWDIQKGLESNRSDKVFLRKLDNMYSELRTDDLELFKAIEKLRDIFSKEKNLSKYLIGKITPQTLELLEHPSYFRPELKRKSLGVSDTLCDICDIP